MIAQDRRDLVRPFTVVLLKAKADPQMQPAPELRVWSQMAWR
jgi:hypothetical protein